MTQPTILIYLTGKPGVGINVSNLSPEDAAMAIMKHIKSLLREKA